MAMTDVSTSLSLPCFSSSIPKNLLFCSSIPFASSSWFSSHTLAATRALASEGDLRKGIAELYDESSSLWESIWGDHMHHGFYDPDEPVSVSDHRLAQIRMIEEVLRFSGLSGESKIPETIVDVGCGIGGCSRYLAKKYEAKCHGITLLLPKD